MGPHERQPPSSADGEWWELSAVAEPEAVESLAELFTRWGQGVAIEQTVESSLDGDVVHVPARAPLLVKTYLSLLDPGAGARREQMERGVWALGRLRQVEPLAVRSIRERDWEDAWKQHFFVHRVGSRTVIVPSWRHDEYEPREGDVVLLLDPGMAFGTGLHPTTRLCLRALEAHDLAGRTLLDLGAGSGILAIAAAKLGAAAVDAVELEAAAARVCGANVAVNGVHDRVRVLQGSLDLLPAEPTYDLVVANITIRVLADVHEALAARMVAGATAILSGVLAERANELLGLLTAKGWAHRHTEREGDWVALTVTAPVAR